MVKRIVWGWPGEGQAVKPCATAWRRQKIGHWQLEKAAPKGNSLDLRRWCWSSDGLHDPAETTKETAKRGAIRVGRTVSVLIQIFENTLALQTHEQYSKALVFLFPGVILFILSKYGGSSSSIVLVLPIKQYEDTRPKRDKPDVVNPVQ